MKISKISGFRVDLKSALTGKFMEYTSLKVPVTFQMACSLATHLKRSRTGGRIVEIPSGRVVEEWENGIQNEQ